MESLAISRKAKDNANAEMKFCDDEAMEKKASDDGGDDADLQMEELIEMHRVVSHLRQRVETLDLDAVKTKAELRRTRIVNCELEEKNRQLAMEAHAEAMARMSAEDAWQQENEEMQAMVQKLSERMEMLEAEANKTKAELRRLRAQNQDLTETVRLGEAGAETVAAELKAELRRLRAQNQDLIEAVRLGEAAELRAKEEVSNLHQERSRLQSLVESKTRQIESLQEPARLANQTIADSEAFKLAAAAIVGASNPSAMDLNLAWERVQNEVNQLRRGQSEVEQDLELAQKKERDNQMDLNHLRNDLNQIRTTLEICELDKLKTQEIAEGHEARVTVLREALEQGIPKEEAARLLTRDFAEELKLAQQKAKANEDVAAARKKALEDLQGEVERLRSKMLPLSEVETAEGQNSRRLEGAETAAGKGGRGTGGENEGEKAAAAAAAAAVNGTLAPPTSFVTNQQTCLNLPMVFLPLWL